MDLILKVGILIVIIVAVTSVVFYAVGKSVSVPGSVNQSQAVNIVLSDVKAYNPNAQVSVLSVTPSTIKSNSWAIVLGISYNSTKPCPTLGIEEFDYPATNLVNSSVNIYTKNCIVYGLSTAPSYVISSPEIAIVLSYTTSDIAQQYVSAYGYDNVSVNATFHPSLAANATPLGIPMTNTWLANYDAPNANYSLNVLLSQSGASEGTYTTNH